MADKKRFSFEGWQFMEWLKGNWSTIKEIIKVGVPYLVATAIVQDMGLQAVIILVGKLILDTGEYFVKEYE